MKKKKGFTLIELLAVIVILAIIALIATPVILNIIEKSRRSAFTRSAENVLKSANNHYTINLMNGEFEEISFTCDGTKCLSSELDSDGNLIDLNVEGNMGKGTVNIDSNGKTEFELSNGAYCATKTLDSNKIEVTKGNCGKLDPKEDTTKPEIKNVSYTKTNNSIKIIVSAKDTESGISYYEYSIDDGATWTEKQTSNIYEYTDLSLGTYKIKVKVYNGAYEYKPEIGVVESETKELVLEVNECPVPTFIVENEHDWAQSKKITIDYGNKDICIGSYSIDGGNTFTSGNEITLNKNGNVIAKNEGGEKIVTATQEVLKIDNAVPTIGLNINSDETYAKTKELRVNLIDNGLSGIASSSFKYGWSTSNTQEPTSYSTVNTSINQTSFEITDFGITGDYYLWVIPINYKTNAGTPNNETIKSTGIFKFDNEGPNVEIGTVTATESTITVPFTASDTYSTVSTKTCEYGTSTSYGKTGTIVDDVCTISGTSDTLYYYKIIVIDSLGNRTEKIGSFKTLTPPTYIAMVYYNPKEDIQCTDYVKSQSNFGVKEGCMRWYAFKQTSSSYYLILDHNTSKSVWNSENNNTDMTELKTALKNDTTGWKKTASLITADEVAAATGNKTWKSTTGKRYYLDNNSEDNKPTSQPYLWLYNGGDYWTSSAPNDSHNREVWCVSARLGGGFGEMIEAYAYNELGVRPVITVSKSKFN